MTEDILDTVIEFTGEAIADMLAKIGTGSDQE